MAPTGGQGGPATEPRVYSVSELNAEVHGLLEGAYPLVWLVGEISNFRLFQASGHWYFTLKDSRAQISAAMFRSRNRHLRFRPEDGMSVLVRGQVSLYDPRGTYQIIVAFMEPRGAGALHAAFAALRARLEAEGLFHAARKRPLPQLPRRVGVVTSRDGAAFRDILQVLRRRHAGVSVLLVPCRVQGEGAAAEIAAAVERAGRAGELDALIVGRGGGSLEDLWAFNEEEVARAIAACPVPVIAAVGHETDVTIADLVADCRAPTPSAAAELVAASREEMLERVGHLGRRLAGATRLLVSRLRAGPAGSFPLMAARALDGTLRQTGQRADDLTGRLLRGQERALERRHRRLESLTGRLSPRSLRSSLATRRERLGGMIGRLRAAAAGRWRVGRQALAVAAGRLGELSPLAVLERGYALAHLRRTGVLLRDAGQAQDGDEVDLRLHRGGLRLEVTGRLDGDGNPAPGAGPGGES